jgi:antitoxin (DNA-binding transcriptional repressor) of toxin-antitoxin stability system
VADRDAVTVTEAKTQLSRLIERVQPDEEIERLFESGS